MMLHTKYQGSRPCGFRQDFFMFYLYKPGAGPNIKALGLVVSDKIFSCSTYISLGRAHFWPQGHNLNNFGRGPLGDATYQISRLGFVVSDKSFKVFISKIYFQPV